MSDGNSNGLSVSKKEHLGLAIQLGHDCRLAHRDIETLRNRVNREGFPFLSVELPKLDKALLAGISDGTFVTPDGFRTKHNSKLPSFLYGLFSEVFDDMGTYLGNQASDAAVRDIHQFTSFFYKVETEFTLEQKFTFAEKFMATEAEVNALTFDKTSPVLRIASDLITSVLAGFNLQDIVCKDGPGATANSTFFNKKSKKLDNYECTSWEYLPLFFSNNNHMWAETHRWPKEGERKEPTSKVCFVPKDSRGPRVISAEPRECQWIQQGIRGFIYDAVERSPLTRGQVNFTDQSINSELAIKASVEKNLATLDLSDASDRISLRLVEILFSGVPQLLDALKVSRSVQTELTVSDDLKWTHKLSKFAPMGSAVCFPVLALVVWSLIKASIYLECSDEQINLPWCDTCPSDEVFVFGDDIIVSSYYATTAINALESHGLKVNIRKSFIECDFSESCGMDAYKGRRITPVRLRHPLRVTPKINGKNSITPKSYHFSHVETANMLASEGRYGAALYLAKHTQKEIGDLPFGYPHSEYLCFHKDPVMERLSATGSPRKAGYWQLKPVTIDVKQESGWTHFHRVLPNLGTNAEKLGFGEYQLPKIVKSVRCRRPKYETAYPKCQWLPLVGDHRYVGFDWSNILTLV